MRHPREKAAADLAKVAEERPSGPELVRMSDVKARPVSWLWPGRIALGKLTLIAGDPGLGKSFLTLDMAARVSRGKPWPDARDVMRTPGGVVLLSAEDDAEDTIKPRLDAAGADASRIMALLAVRRRDPGSGRVLAHPFNLATDLPALADAIREVGDCQLVVVDPISAYMGLADSHVNAEVRGLLAPLSALAAEHGVAVVAVSHLNKSAGGRAIYRTMGSLAFTAAARAAWVVVAEADGPRRLLLPVKNNIAPDAGGLAFRVEITGADGAPAVSWESDPVMVRADAALAAEGGTPGGGGPREEAVEWLRDVLADGPVAAKEVRERAETDGIKSRTLDRGKSILGVVATREGYATGGRWLWTMPAQRAPQSPLERQPQSVAHKGAGGAQSDRRLSR